LTIAFRFDGAGTMTHIMLDLETWGKTPGSDIRSIGVVVFDPVAGNVGIDCNEQMIIDFNKWSFYIATDNPEQDPYINPNYYLDMSGRRSKYPLTRDPETIDWWNDQSEEAQAAFANPVELRDACFKFGEWLRDFDKEFPYYYVTGEKETYSDNIRLWANDPHFDVSILDAVYRAVGLPVPWHYRAPRSMKTITDAAGMTRDDFKPFEYGTYHNALDDAISQAMIVCEAYKRLGLQRP